MNDHGSAPQSRMRRFLDRWIKFRVADAAPLVFERVADASGLLIDGTPYLTLSQAAVCLAVAMGRTGADSIAPLYNSLVDGSLPTTLRAPAPPHEAPMMTGPVRLDPDFWKRCWWPGMAMGNLRPSDDWLAWFLAGGIVVPMDVLELLAKPLAAAANQELATAIRETLFRREAIVRTEFQLFWPVTDVLAWIVSRDEAEVASIAQAMNPLSPDDPVPPWESVDAIAERHCKLGQQVWQILHDALMDLANRLHAGDLSAKEWPLKSSSLQVLAPADFDRARLMHGHNSAGLLGGDFIGRVNHYVLIRPDDVKTLWPASKPVHIGAALLVPLPATLPHIGPVIGMEEAICLVAYGKSSFNASAWQNPNGTTCFTNPDGIEIQTGEAGEMPPHMTAYLQASRAIHTALRDGALASYVVPEDGRPLRIPHLHWNSVSSEYLGHIYRGTMAVDVGAGCPVLLSRPELDVWSASQKGDVEAGKVVLKYSNQEILEWIDSSAFTDVKKARTAFMQEPRASGLSGTFEHVWNDKFKRGKGRPLARKH